MVGSFSHYDNLLRTREVPRGGPVSELRRAEPDLELTYLHEGALRTLTDYVDRNPVTGLLIAKGDTILFEHYQYGRTDRHRFVSQSMAKTVTAMLIGIAVAEGKIASIEDRVERYVPGLAGTEYGGTTLRSLLTMSSGVLFREDYDGADDMARLGRDLFRPESPGPVSAVRQFNTRAAPADSVFHYASIETEILGLVLHEARRHARRRLPVEPHLAAARGRGRRRLGDRPHRAGSDLLLPLGGVAGLCPTRPDAGPC